MNAKWMAIVVAALCADCHGLRRMDVGGTDGVGEEDGGNRDGGDPLDSGPTDCEEPDARAPVPWDGDHDGFTSAACGGDDCNDSDAVTHPGAADGEREWSVRELTHSDGPPAIALDSTRTPWVSTAEVVGTPSGGEWSVVRDEYTGHFDYVPIAVDGTGAVHILYQVSSEEPYGDVQHAALSGGGWSNEIALATDSITNTHDRSSGLAIDSLGALHAVFRFPPNQAGQSDLDVTYLTNRGGAWTVETVDPSPSSRTTVEIAIASDGSVHVVYPWAAEGVASEVRWATNASGIWSIETVVSAEWLGNMAAIALDEVDAPHVVFDDSDGALQHAERSGGTWMVDEIDETGQAASIEADASGVLHVVYEKDSGVWYASGLGGAWSTEEVQPQMGDSGYSREINLAAETSGVSHVVFLDQVDEGLYYAVHQRSDGVDQNCDGVDGLDADSDGHASIATGGDDCDDESAARWEGC